MTIAPSPCPAARLASLVRGYRFNFADESSLQAGFERVLQKAQILYRREYELRPHGRIDFWLPHFVGNEKHVGVELKTQGSPAAVGRQLDGYAQHEEVAELVLLTAKASLRTQPPTRNGKPMGVVSLWTNGL